jgi:DNA-binding beta-propeller fold protein YncE
MRVFVRSHSTFEKANPIFQAALLAASLWSVAGTTSADDLIVSANDAKFVRVEGRGTYPPDPPADTLTVLNASKRPPEVVATVEVQHTIHGPPQSVAITPDGTLAFVSAPDRYDYDAERQTKLSFIQVIDLTAEPPSVVAKVDVGSHPQALAITPDGSLLMATTLTGKVAMLAIRGSQVRLADEIALSQGKLAGIAITADGRTAIVANRDDQGLSVLSIENGKVSDTGERISSGVTPYAVDVSADGRWAVVSNVGLAAIDGRKGTIYGDADTVSLIDTSRRPFRAVQHLTVPSIPEGVAISPDGRFIAALCMDGSSLTPDNPGHKPRGALVLFRIQQGKAKRVSAIATGTAPQGVVFTEDSRRLLVQMNVDKSIAVYEVRSGRLRDTKQRIDLTGGPTSIRSMPRGRP